MDISTGVNKIIPKKFIEHEALAALYRVPNEPLGEVIIPENIELDDIEIVKCHLFDNFRIHRFKQSHKRKISNTPLHKI